MTTELFPQILGFILVAAVLGAAAFWLGRRSARKSDANIAEHSAAGKTPDTRSDGHGQAQESVAGQKVGSEAESTGNELPQAIPSVSWFSRLSSGMSKTQNQLIRQIESLFTSQNEKASREAILDAMLEILVRADVGIRTAEMLIERVRHELPGAELSDAGSVKTVLRKEILSLLKSDAGWSLTSPEQKPAVVLMVGVNGVGKTTTTGKLAFKERQAGKTVIVGAADTFRAAAVDQLEQWAHRAGAECVRLSEGADPASVAFECVKRAVGQQSDLCLVDTAGRLHNRQDLMQELAKIKRVASKDVQGAPHEVLLVLDATTGQNALQQAKAFREIAGVTGLVLTKLDGTAKGGVAIALANEMKLPIRYIGVGESVDDLQPFVAEEFVDALFAPHSSQTADKTSRSEVTGSITL
ncbi:MAG: signal recognition particle-docking protein FtsY [Proteobacteria bacterium]|nr:signal recognition particle-docking protein FtsY [Pseudomonadota bacterium]